MIGSILKLASKRGGGSMDELTTVLSALGIELQMSSVSLQDAPDALRSTAMAASRRGASLQRLQGVMKNGDRIEAFIVMVPGVTSVPENSFRALDAKATPA